jgi:hypothetical protein
MRRSRVTKERNEPDPEFDTIVDSILCKGDGILVGNHITSIRGVQSSGYIVIQVRFESEHLLLCEDAESFHTVD